MIIYLFTGKYIHNRAEDIDGTDLWGQKTNNLIFHPT